MHTSCTLPPHDRHQRRHSCPPRSTCSLGGVDIIAFYSFHSRMPMKTGEDATRRNPPKIKSQSCLSTLSVFALCPLLLSLTLSWPISLILPFFRPQSVYHNERAREDEQEERRRRLKRNARNKNMQPTLLLRNTSFRSRRCRT